MADLKTDFTATMDELQIELVQDIENMDLSAEAIAQGRATIQGYIDGAWDMLPAVRGAYAGLGREAINAMGSPSYSGGVPTARRITGRGYASGTRNAEPGWAMVGEEGPEVLFFNGGEVVLNARQTSALLAKPEPAVSALPAAGAGGSAARPSVEISIHIEGNATKETAEEIGARASEIADLVIDRLENERIDAMRSAYR
ncbi:hypothetical protein D1159_16115 [Pseudoflavonifractor sp. 524-17]|uniref:hypothetical protein n=1 Tax=Pseudoflavonifractor sp. 524-17 TaxID=2304577 RepID=UPI0013799B50|nr:hypothetical protein [Pseudoflavonifractor sp. 524-17]NCE66062.1 hypothetical protein [Pseudoflavonifractor sp. 524-17]